MNSRSRQGSRDLELSAADGQRLAATAFGTADDAAAAVLIVGAMGVAQRFYARFAQWLAAQGYWVLTFDYRGIGRSRPSSHARTLRGFEADLTTWATQDVAAAVEFAAAQVQGRPLLWIGHSLGGQVLGLVPNRARVAAMLSIATGSGYWRENSPPLRRVAWWLWYVVAPLSLRLFGYFPGRRLRKVGDLPAGVMAQWRRWCLHPDYLGMEGAQVRAAYSGVPVPVSALSFTDDEYMSARNVEALHGMYGPAWRRHERLAPADVGAGRIGHFGFFERRFAESLWPRALAWLADASAASRAQSSLSMAAVSSRESGSVVLPK